jgi:chitin disaccharide deacetylase
MARILLNADDFGFDTDTTKSTIECFERGGLTSATIMANMPATEAAAAFAKAHPEFSFGAHLTFTSDGVEFPVLPRSRIPDITSENGQFLPPLTFRGGAFRNRFPDAQLDAELEAQLGKLRDLGVPLSHVDSHGHVHKYGQLRRAIARVLPRFGMRRVRTVQGLFLRRPLKSPAYWLGPWWRRAIQARFLTTPHFYMPTTAWDRSWTDAALHLIESRVGRDEIVEVGVHPGVTEPWRDLERIECVAFGQAARARGHAMATWNDL